MSSAGQVQPIKNSCELAIDYLYLHYQIELNEVNINSLITIRTGKTLDKDELLKTLLVFAYFLINIDFTVNFRDKGEQTKCDNSNTIQILNKYINYYKPSDLNIDEEYIKKLVNNYYLNPQTGIQQLNYNVLKIKFTFYESVKNLIDNQKKSEQKLTFLNIPESTIFVKKQENSFRIMNSQLDAIGKPLTGAGGGYNGLLGEIQTLINSLPEAEREVFTVRLSTLQTQSQTYTQKLDALNQQLVGYQALVEEIQKKDAEIAGLLTPGGGAPGTSAGTSYGGGYSLQDSIIQDEEEEDTQSEGEEESPIVMKSEPVKKSRGRPVKNTTTIKKTSLKKTYKNATLVNSYSE